ncbi:hypothetical protein TeGR_g1511 [Tetraparma gracilis]|uniref:Uncharacterized protein n=1 Tax=Tetraparma gracilis TaxID=2962635 RepID=A0ABQ6N1M4_9STRA|nr:hypothetical protein TeGR_g1511 [Tetraparma gracilis]
MALHLLALALLLWLLLAAPCAPLSSPLLSGATSRVPPSFSSPVSPSAAFEAIADLPIFSPGASSPTTLSTVLSLSQATPKASELLLRLMHEPRLYDNPQLSVACVSIGTPEKALLVCENLGIDKDLLYVDPEADVHRKLGLEKSIQSTFLSPQTPLAMKKILVDDFAKSKTLRSVLAKWIRPENKLLVLPPDKTQAYNQGGALLFDGDRRLRRAHYDRATGDHAEFQWIVDGLNEL